MVRFHEDDGDGLTTQVRMWVSGVSVQQWGNSECASILSETRQPVDVLVRYHNDCNYICVTSLVSGKRGPPDIQSSRKKTPWGHGLRMVSLHQIFLPSSDVKDRCTWSPNLISYIVKLIFLLQRALKVITHIEPSFEMTIYVKLQSIFYNMRIWQTFCEFHMT